jgi:hypothetical protein
VDQPSSVQAALVDETTDLLWVGHGGVRRAGLKADGIGEVFGVGWEIDETLPRVVSACGTDRSRGAVIEIRMSMEDR